ncbi:AI-2E family transporter [Klebsiella pneumoniae subsp. pneumoniae]|nr:AI-2E family transporter [Klebsiella pneumoniae subsp. pneumoniae]
MVKYSLASLPVGVTSTLAVLSGVLVPLMVFFLLKDKEQMLNAVLRALAAQSRACWAGVERDEPRRITNYIRGRVLEMIVVGVATWIGLSSLALNYSLLLAVLVSSRG